MEPIRSFSRHRIPSSSDRLLTLLSQSPPSASSPSAFVPSHSDELSEDDVLWNGELAGSPNSLTSSSANPPANKNHLRATKSIGRTEKFGILAALSEIEDRNKIRSIFDLKKTSSAKSSSCSAMMIPVIPRPPLERTLSSSFRHHQYQSVPINVPLRMRDDVERRREGRLLEESDLIGKGDEEEEMLPPHEIVAKQALKEPILSCSVLEGAGRTLKGRDLRRVRNAVFRQTGFID